MGTGKDHDIEQFAAMLGLPYYRIPLTGEVRDVTLIGSTKLHGDGKGGTESRWQDGDITRALRGPALVNLSELNAAGAETLFALHGLLDRYAALDLPNGETVQLRGDAALRDDEPDRPARLRRHPDAQQGIRRPLGHLGEGLPTADEITSMLEVRYRRCRHRSSRHSSRLAVEVNASFRTTDQGTRVETPMSLRTVLDRVPAGLMMQAGEADPLRQAWDSMVLPHVDPYDRDHYDTVWNAVVRKGPAGPPFKG